MFGCAGTRLTPVEHALFKDADPFGFILFKRNCESPDQLKYLIHELKHAVGRDQVIVAIDQEGGRVARLQPPHWPKYPAARKFGMMYERNPDWGVEAIRCYTRVIAYELTRLGFSINCAPVVDLFNPGGTPALGDRCFSMMPDIVAALARAQAETFMANGILPVIKHLPGHGRLKVDPHHLLPRIEATLTELETLDFMPFLLLKDIPLGMNSHAIFTALDPTNPASLSRTVNREIIRLKLGFDGLLLSDDITMKALNGKPGDLATRALDAGNDIVLHCSGDSSEMEAISRALDIMGEAAWGKAGWARWEHAQKMVKPIDPAYSPAADAVRLDVLLGGLAFDTV
jgi:beta-N-acetylhexosaminidase